MKRDIQSYRTRLQNITAAEKYATRFERGGRKRIDRREQRAVRAIFSGLENCRSVLDVPSGAGRFLDALGPGDRRVIEMDVAFEVLEIARDRAIQRGARAHFIHGDASRLPLADASVDAVFCNRLLHHIVKENERAIIIRELHRVTRRYLVVSYFDYLSLGGIRKALKSLTRKNQRYEGQPTRAQFEAEMARCGFRVKSLVPTGPVWVSQKYFVLEKV